MSRHRKCIIPLLLASMTIGAVLGIPSSANAAVHETKAGVFIANVSKAETAKIDTEQTAAGKDTLTLNGLTLTCTSIKGSGTALSGGTSPTEISVTPSYETCHVVVAGLTKTVTFTTNGCAYVFDAKTTVTESGSFDHTATTTLECPAGKQIEVHVYNEKEAEGTLLCTYDLKPQGPLSGTSLTNKVNTPTSANDAVAALNVTIAVVNTKLSALCGEKEASTAIYKGEDTVRATNAKGSLVDLGASITSSEAPIGEFTANVSPKVIAGIDVEQVSTNTFLVNGLSITCATAKFIGNSLNLGPSFSEVTLTPKVETCHVVIAGITKIVTFTGNHCAFVVITTANSEGGVTSYPVDSEVECEHPGEAIQIHVYGSKESEASTLCTFDLGEQGPISSGELVNSPNTPSFVDDVTANFEINLEVQNTIESLLCGSKATESMLFRGEDTVQATNGAGEAVETSVS